MAKRLSLLVSFDILHASDMIICDISFECFDEYDSPLQSQVADLCNCLCESANIESSFLLLFTFDHNIIRLTARRAPHTRCLDIIGTYSRGDAILTAEGTPSTLLGASYGIPIHTARNFPLCFSRLL